MDRYKDLVAGFKKHINENTEVECCGIITRNFEYIPCDNLSPVPSESFVLDPRALFKYGEDCWGIFHSHTAYHDVLPSDHDKNSAIFKQYKFIVGSPKEEYYLYWLDDLNYLRFKPLEESDLQC